MRHYYAERYDTRANMVDWDYHMRLRSTSKNMPTPAPNAKPSKASALQQQEKQNKLDNE